MTQPAHRHTCMLAELGMSWVFHFRCFDTMRHYIEVIFTECHATPLSATIQVANLVNYNCHSIEDGNKKAVQTAEMVD